MKQDIFLWAWVGGVVRESHLSLRPPQENIREPVFTYWRRRVPINSSYFRCHVQANVDTTNLNTDLENSKKKILFNDCIFNIIIINQRTFIISMAKRYFPKLTKIDPLLNLKDIFKKIQKSKYCRERKTKITPPSKFCMKSKEK